MERRTEDIKIAIENVKQSRLQDKQRFDTKMRNRPKNATIEVGTKVLVHQTKLDKQHTDKLANRWIGPYIVDKILEGKVYVLKELDGTVAKWTISGDRLKKFHERGYEVREGAWDEYRTRLQKSGIVMEDGGQNLKEDDGRNLEDESENERTGGLFSIVVPEISGREEYIEYD